jgi:hypothetical protein
MRYKKTPTAQMIVAKKPNRPPAWIPRTAAFSHLELPFWNQRRCEALESRTALNSEDAFHWGQRREFPSLKPMR